MSRFQVTQNSILASCHNFAKGDIDLKPFHYIPAVKHASAINALCQQNPLLKQARLYCVAIVHNDSQFFYTSNDPYLSAAYISTGLYRADNFFYQALQSGQDVLLASQLDDSDAMRQLVLQVLSVEFHLYNSYCLVRRCEDCAVIIAIALHENVQDHQLFYQQTFNELQLFTTVYLNQFLSLYLENIPSLRHTRFAHDKAYRDKVITNQYAQPISAVITERETQCLYWLSLGKTASETAALMAISEYTVVEYKKKIMQKLNVSNMVHAVREAMQLNLI